ncbi:hypothetical protein [Sphingomonas sp. RT2P30]|uniref:hypothetical protein n=1 Tax=Parasphingomonas halimpatiens TaxID=3096162 RepID=UPI002FC61663
MSASIAAQRAAAPGCGVDMSNATVSAPAKKKAPDNQPLSGGRKPQRCSFGNGSRLGLLVTLVAFAMDLHAAPVAEQVFNEHHGGGTLFLDHHA